MTAPHHRFRRSAALLALTLAAPASVACQGGPAPDRRVAVYEYVYEYNTAELIENHYIVLDSAEGTPRGWYYGTSDEFDTVREGYLPGFFVAPMQALRVAADGTLGFTLVRPDTFFTTPVPLRFRSAGEVPPGALEPWTAGVVLEAARDYAGTLGTGEVVLTLERSPRVFRRIASPPGS